MTQTSFASSRRKVLIMQKFPTGHQWCRAVKEIELASLWHCSPSWPLCSDIAFTVPKICLQGRTVCLVSIYYFYLCPAVWVRQIEGYHWLLKTLLCATLPQPAILPQPQSWGRGGRYCSVFWVEHLDFSVWNDLVAFYLAEMKDLFYSSFDCFLAFKQMLIENS